jgi:hypothetical protein
MGKNWYVETAARNPLPLETGDKVIVWWNTRFGDGVGYIIGKVRKTKTQLVVDHEFVEGKVQHFRFYHDGRHIDGKTWSTTRRYIEPYTDEKKAKLDAEIARVRWERYFQDTWKRVGSGDFTQEEKKTILPIFEAVVERKEKLREERNAKVRSRG